MPIDQMLTFKETCKTLGVGHNLLSRLMANGEISYTLLGHRRIMFTEQAIKDYLNSRTVKAKPPIVTTSPEATSFDIAHEKGHAEALQTTNYEDAHQIAANAKPVDNGGHNE